MKSKLYKIHCFTVSADSKVWFYDYQRADTDIQAMQKSKEKYRLHKYGVHFVSVREV